MQKIKILNQELSLEAAEKLKTDIEEKIQAAKKASLYWPGQLVKCWCYFQRESSIISQFVAFRGEKEHPYLTKHGTWMNCEPLDDPLIFQFKPFDAETERMPVEKRTYVRVLLNNGEIRTKEAGWFNWGATTLDGIAGWMPTCGWRKYYEDLQK